MADNNGAEQGQEEFVDEQEAEQEGETPEANGNQGDNEPESNGDAEDEVVITIGEEPPPQEEAEKEAAPQWVKELRKRERELARENRELKAAAATKAEPAKELGAKPTLEECEFDTDVFEQKLTAWHERKRSVEAQAEQQRQAAEQAQKAWQTKLDSYNAGKASLKVSDFEDAEAAVLEMLDTTQQGIILAGADNPTNLTYALGKNPAKLKELASIKDPVKYAFAVAKLETQLKVTQRKSAPPAERRIVGNAAAVAVNDPKLARLEAEADKTGDRTALVAYKKAMKSKAA